MLTQYEINVHIQLTNNNFTEFTWPAVVLPGFALFKIDRRFSVRWNFGSGSAIRCRGMQLHS